MILGNSEAAQDAAFLKLEKAGFEFEFEAGFLKVWGRYPLGTIIITDYGVDDFIRDASEFKTELTTEGEQFVIPGCEPEPERADPQGSLW